MGGPPLSVDWKAVAHVTLSLNDYEAACGTPRNAEELLLPEQERIMILKAWGYTLNDIRRLSRPVHIVRAQRQATRLKYANGQRPVDMTFKDIVQNVLFFGCHSKKKRELAKQLEDDDSSSCRFAQAQDVRMHSVSNSKKKRSSKSSSSPPLVPLYVDKSDKSNGSSESINTMEISMRSGTSQLLAQ